MVKRYIKAILGGWLAILAAFGWTVTIVSLSLYSQEMLSGESKYLPAEYCGPLGPSVSDFCCRLLSGISSSVLNELNLRFP